MVAAFKAVFLLLATTAKTLATESPFISLSSGFDAILGQNPKVTTLFNTTIPFFHEMGVYHPPSDSLFMVSSRFTNPEYNNNRSGTVMTHIANVSSSKPQMKHLTDLKLTNPVSGARWTKKEADVIAVVTNGGMEINQPAGLFFMNPYPPFNVTPMTTSYGVYPYNSLDDLTILPDGTMYYTDLVYGYIHGLRPKPLLPNQVYRYDPFTNTTRAVADLFYRPNGIAHSPDGSILYVGDTGINYGDGRLDWQEQRSIYAYSIRNMSSGVGGTAGPFLTDRRVFVLPQVGVADGIEVDTNGHVWAQSTDGLHCYDPNGNLLGKILLDGVTGGNFGFGKPGTIYSGGANALYRIELSSQVQGNGVV